MKTKTIIIVLISIAFLCVFYVGISFWSYSKIQNKKFDNYWFALTQSLSFYHVVRDTIPSDISIFLDWYFKDPYSIWKEEDIKYMKKYMNPKIYKGTNSAILYSSQRGFHYKPGDDLLDLNKADFWDYLFSFKRNIFLFEERLDYAVLEYKIFRGELVYYDGDTLWQIRKSLNTLNQSLFKANKSFKFKFKPNANTLFVGTKLESGFYKYEILQNPSKVSQNNISGYLNHYKPTVDSLLEKFQINELHFPIQLPDSLQ